MKILKKKLQQFNDTYEVLMQYISNVVTFFLKKISQTYHLVFILQIIINLKCPKMGNNYNFVTCK